MTANKPPFTPSNFLGSPSLHPSAAPVAARVVVVEAVKVKPALLTVDPRGRTYLSVELCAAMPSNQLRHRQPIDPQRRHVGRVAERQVVGGGEV